MKQVLKRIIWPRPVQRPAWQEVLKWVIVGLAVSLLLVFTQQSAAAATFRPPERETGNLVIPAGETVKEDLYAFGGDIRILGNVDGDLIVGAGRVTVAGNVSQDLIVLGGEVILTGTVSDDLRVAGGTVKIDGTVGDAVNIAAGTVIFTSKARIGGDIAGLGSTIEFDGQAAKGLNLVGGTVTIFGRVDGNVNVSANSLRLADTAEIRGNLSAKTQQKVLRADGARILGKFTEKRIESAQPLLSRVVSILISLIGLTIVGLILLWLLGSRSADLVRASMCFWKSLGVGTLILVVAPAAVIISMLTIVGFPTAVICALLLGISIYFAQIVAGLALGTIILKIGNLKREVNVFLSFLVGIVVLKLLMALPYVGWLVSLVAILWGLGALLTASWTFLGELKLRAKK